MPLSPPVSTRDGLNTDLSTEDKSAGSLERHIQRENNPFPGALNLSCSCSEFPGLSASPSHTLFIAHFTLLNPAKPPSWLIKGKQ